MKTNITLSLNFYSISLAGDIVDSYDLMSESLWILVSSHPINVCHLFITIIVYAALTIAWDLKSYYIIIWIISSNCERETTSSWNIIRIIVIYSYIRRFIWIILDIAWLEQTYISREKIILIKIFQWLLNVDDCFEIIIALNSIKNNLMTLRWDCIFYYGYLSIHGTWIYKCISVSSIGKGMSIK